MKMVPGEPCSTLEPLFPPAPLQEQGGHPRVSDHAALGEVLLVLRTSRPLEYLPSEIGSGRGTTYWCWLRDSQEAGAQQRLEGELLHRLGDAEAIDCNRAALNSTVVPAPNDWAVSSGSRHRPLATGV